MIPQDAVRTAVLQATVQSMTDVLQYTIHKIERNRCANLRIALIQVKSRSQVDDRSSSSGAKKSLNQYGKRCGTQKMHGMHCNTFRHSDER